MHAALATLIDRMDDPRITRSGVIRWGAPVPSFGDLATSRVATLGLNPSNREFVDEAGIELDGRARRFHTFQSLGIRSWEEANASHLRLILNSCRNYFLCNPYDRWFKRLDEVVSGTKTSFYGDSNRACHLDLIPYATFHKWTDLTPVQRMALLSSAGDVLALLLRDSPVQVLLLNGASVVEHFEQLTGLDLERREMKGWGLCRRRTKQVRGISYRGILRRLCGVSLSREVLVLGYNHNIQSSFGVTTQVVDAIRSWVSTESDQAPQ
jgi:hypothetical protein